MGRARYDDENDNSDHVHAIPLWQRIASLIILTVLHGMTFADRFCVAGALGALSKFYDIDDSMGGLIQTLFLVASIIGSPFAGYFGDRYNRKLLLIFGVALWIVVMVASSFVPRHMFWLFLVLRCIDGFSENFVYACAPSLIADYFSGQPRSYAFMVFYYAINVGCAFGAMLGAVISTAGEAYWQWSLRFVPCITILAWIGVIFLLREPKRGASEKIAHVEKTSSFVEDMIYLAKIKTFVIMCFAVAAVNMTAGSQGWWNALIVLDSMKANTSGDDVRIFDHETYSAINLVSGFVGIISSIAGVTFVVWWAEQWKSGSGCFSRFKTIRAPALVIAISLTIAAPFTYLQQPFLLWSVYGYYVCQFITTFFTGSSWVLSIDVTYAVTSSNRRSISIATLTLVQHLLGDGPGPYISGIISDSFRGDDKTSTGHMWGLLHAFFIINIFTSIAFILFYLVAYTMKKDYHQNQQDAIDQRAARRRTVTNAISTVAMKENGIYRPSEDESF